MPLAQPRRRATRRAPAERRRRDVARGRPVPLAQPRRRAAPHAEPATTLHALASPWLLPAAAMLDAQVVWTVIFLLVLGLGSMGVAELRARDRLLLAPPPHDVAAIRVAVDARTRPFLETELARIASAYSGSAPAQAAARLAATCALLRQLRLAWTHVGAHDHAMAAPDVAARSVERHLALAITPLPPARPGEPACVLITLVVEASCELFEIARGDDPEQVRRALEVLPSLPASALRRVEVALSPGDRAPAADRALAVALPQLRRLADPRAGVAVCARCACPFPAALLACPRCHAPAGGVGRRG